MRVRTRIVKCSCGYSRKLSNRPCDICEGWLDDTPAPDFRHYAQGRDSVLVHQSLAGMGSRRPPGGAMLWTGLHNLGK